MVNLYFTSLESEPKNCDDKFLVNADFLPENPALIMLMALGSRLSDLTNMATSGWSIHGMARCRYIGAQITLHYSQNSPVIFGCRVEDGEVGEGVRSRGDEGKSSKTSESSWLDVCGDDATSSAASSGRLQRSNLGDFAL